MSNAELAEYYAYYKMDPWGEERDDLRAGIVASTIVNVNRGKGKKAYQPRDFMPKFERDEDVGESVIEIFKHIDKQNRSK